jgi:hypothetical protein
MTGRAPLITRHLTVSSARSADGGARRQIDGWAFRLADHGRQNDDRMVVVTCVLTPRSTSEFLGGQAERVALVDGMELVLADR